MSTRYSVQGILDEWALWATEQITVNDSTIANAITQPQSEECYPAVLDNGVPIHGDNILCNGSWGTDILVLDAGYIQHVDTSGNDFTVKHRPGELDAVLDT